MHRLLIAVVFCWLSATGTALAAFPAVFDLNDYKGADAGRLAFSVSSDRDTRVMAYFHRADGTGDGVISAVAQEASFWSKPDFKETNRPPRPPPELEAAGREYVMGKPQGRVAWQALPPGRYVIYRVFAYDSFHAGDFVPIAFSFEVKPGRTTYVGNFRILAIYGESALSRLSAWDIATSDQSPRDVPILRTKASDLGEVDVAAPNAILRSRAPAKEDMRYFRPR